MTWLPGFTRVPIGSGGRPHGQPVTRICLHTTEGSSIGGAEAAYRARGVPPHVTYHPGDRVGHQHVRLDRAAESLWHVDDTGVLQVELVGFATAAPHWGDDWLSNIALDVIVPMLRAVPTIPLRTDVTWLPYPDSYGRSPARLTFDQWSRTFGIVGHSHAPAKPRPWPLSKTNAHGDPGALNVPRIVDLARPHLETQPTPTPPPTGVLPMPEHLIQCPPANGAVLARYADGHLSHIGGAEYAHLKSKSVRELTENDPAAAARYVAEAAFKRTP